jgi:anti-sigma regulatory factor (Ser/Thr protein kinase)
MSRLYIPNSVALRNFETVFKKNDYDFTDGNIDISFHPSYVAMHPVGLAFYAALADNWRDNKYKVSGAMNKKISSIPYLQRMGLFRALGFLDPVKIVEHEPTGRFIPLTKVKNSSELDCFMRSIDPLLHTNRENSKCIKHVFSEMIRNVIEHSYSDNGANVCATYNKNSKKIAIGISDNGIGLFKSLVRNHRIHNDKEAIIKALTPGISGTTSKIGGTAENAGAGLFYTKCIAQTTRNHMIIYSGSSFYKLYTTKQAEAVEFNADPTKDRSKYLENLPYFHGTLIGIDIHIDDNGAFYNLMNNIGIAYKNSIHKSNKDYYRRIRFV